MRCVAGVREVDRAVSSCTVFPFAPVGVPKMRVLAQCHRRAVAKTGQAADPAVKAALDFLAQRIAFKALDMLAKDDDDLFCEGGVQIVKLLKDLVSSVPYSFCRDPLHLSVLALDSVNRRSGVCKRLRGLGMWQQASTAHVSPILLLSFLSSSPVC